MTDFGELKLSVFKIQLDFQRTGLWKVGRLKNPETFSVSKSHLCKCDPLVLKSWFLACFQDKKKKKKENIQTLLKLSRQIAAKLEAT